MDEYDTNIPAEAIGEPELTAILAPLAKRAGVAFVLKHQYVITVNDPIFSDLVDNVKEMILRDPPKAKPFKKIGKVRRKRAKAKGEKPLGLHSYRNETTDDVVSKQWINKQLKARELAKGTTFVNGDGERFEVVSDENNIDSDAPFILLKVVEQ